MTPASRFQTSTGAAGRPIEPPSDAIRYPDDDRFKCCIGVKGSSDKIYKIAFDTSVMFWRCSCLGNISHGDCKHLKALGFKGRKYGAQKTVPVFAAPRAEQVAVCQCGCGRALTGRQTKYATPACRPGIFQDKDASPYGSYTDAIQARRGASKRPTKPSEPSKAQRKFNFDE